MSVSSLYRPAVLSAFSPLPMQVKSNSISWEDILITKYLTEQQRKDLLAHEVSSLEIDQYVAIINSPEGMVVIASDLENYKKNAILAFHAMLSQQITVEQFASQCILYAALDEYIVNQVRYEPRIKPNGQFEYYKIHLDTTVVPPLKIFMRSVQDLGDEGARILKGFLQGDDQAVKYLKECLADEPLSENYFFEIQLPPVRLAVLSPILDAIRRVTNFFSTVDTYQGVTMPEGYEQPQSLIIPSFSIVKCFLKKAFPDSSMDLQPVLGKLSTRTIIENKMNGIRLINIGLPGADVPEEVDGIVGGKLPFIYHDLYHALRDCIVPDSMFTACKRIKELSDEILSQTVDVTEAKAIKKAIWKMFDNEIFASTFNYDKKKATIEPFSYIFQRINCPHILLKAIKSDITHTPRVWKSVNVGLHNIDTFPRY